MKIFSFHRCSVSVLRTCLGKWQTASQITFPKRNLKGKTCSVHTGCQGEQRCSSHLPLESEGQNNPGEWPGGFSFHLAAGSDQKGGH